MKMELKDIQGLLVRGHGDLPSASYLLLHIEDAERAREWLGKNLEKVTDGASKPPGQRYQIAFTYSGLEKLGAGSFISHGLSVEFVQGMATEYRSRILGDLGQSASACWEWGGPENQAIDILLAVFTVDDGTLAYIEKELEEDFAHGGMELVWRLGSESNSHQKEHFGFRDGIGQPIIEGLSKKGPKENTIPAGEFILGYQNAYRQLSESPVVEGAMDPDNLLPPHSEQRGFKDFGKNGSYMVFRQLYQEVSGFWKQVKEAVCAEKPEADHQACIQLAAKMVGRWPNGTPITLSPEGEREDMAKENDFLYAKDDPHGFQCPWGSHIRRANPRDLMPDNKPKSSLKVSNRHRLLRRGRNFGPPLAPSFDVRDLIDAKDDKQKRGLHFICFNTNISRQFEFVQHTWSNNTKFAGLYNDPDPILGIKDSRNKADTHDFTIEAEPVRRKIQGLSRHVHVLGGAYFFMPSLRALRFLAEFKPNATAGNS